MTVKVSEDLFFVPKYQRSKMFKKYVNLIVYPLLILLDKTSKSFAQLTLILYGLDKMFT